MVVVRSDDDSNDDNSIIRGTRNVVLIGKTNSILVCKLIEVAMMKAVILE